MSKNEMVSVPRELAQMAADAIDDLLTDGVSAVSAAAWVDVTQKVRAILAQPAEQHQGEPVAWHERWDECERIADIHGVREALQMFSEDPTGDAGTSLIREVLTAMEADPGEVERLRTENERLKQTSVKEEVFDIVCKERDALRAELAERDTLLTGAEKVIDQFMPNVGKCCGLDFALLNETLMGIRAALSASAEPGVKS